MSEELFKYFNTEILYYHPSLNINNPQDADNLKESIKALLMTEKIDDYFKDLHTKNSTKITLGPFHKNILDKQLNEYLNISDDDIKQIDNYNNILEKLNNSFYKLNKSENIIFKTLSSNKEFLKKLNIVKSYKKEDTIYQNLINYIDNSISEVMDILKIYNMIENIDDKLILSNNGIIGSYITDIEPIICADIITHPVFLKLEHIDILLVLSTIVFDETTQNRVTINEIKDYKWKIIINELINKYQINKHYNYIEQFNFDFINLFETFLETGIFQSNIKNKDYLFEGNFIRIINRLLNLLNEIKFLSEITKNIHLMNIIAQSIEVIESHQWLKPDSIYLRMSNIVI